MQANLYQTSFSVHLIKKKLIEPKTVRSAWHFFQSDPSLGFQGLKVENYFDHDSIEVFMTYQ